MRYLEMIVLRYSIIEHVDDKCYVFYILICKGAYVLEHTNAKCHLCTSLINL